MVNIARNVLIHPKQSATEALKTTSKRAAEKSTKATADLMSNENADKVTKNSSQNNSNTDSQTIEKSIKRPKKINISEEYVYKNDTLLVI